jgi:arsenate reductase-like glutaredoxin family protein
VSCERTRAVLQAQKVSVQEERAARKSPLSDDDARALLSQVERVTLTKGKNAQTFAASQVTLDQLRGPTGNFRAPMLRRGASLLVGFSEPALLSFLQE